MKLFGILFFILFYSAHCFSQQDSSREISLPSVIIKAFGQSKRLKDVPASVNYIGKNIMERFGNSSIVSALNSTPGIRMEERSPGSYRLNIRGSSLRSPFGVRNVKIYYNDIPYTDPGGHSYFNQLGYYNFNSIEIIKGANNSMYGAGTGGVMLIESLSDNEKTSALAEFAVGSYNMQNLYGSVVTANEKSVSGFGLQHQSSDGYREHSKMKRDVFGWNGSFHFSENKILKTSFLYSDLFYETPGALTKSEFDANPRSARPAVGSLPGAVSANAYIRQHTFLAGASYSQPLTSNIDNKTVLYGMFTELRNPAISSYGKNSEPHAGGRTVFRYHRLIFNTMLNFDLGGEVQQGFSSFSTHKNVGGNADSLRSYDEVNNRQAFVFAQATVDLKNWTFISGASLNQLRVNFQRFTPATSGKQKRVFDNQVAPRLAVMRKFGNINFYTSVARGFSPPTTAELVPTGGAINLGLNAEEGINYDAGVKAAWKDLYIDINAFYFTLKNTIVLRRNANGSDFYVNAGSTKQLGIESYAGYTLFPSSSIFTRSMLWLSTTLYNFHYREFKQLTNDFSGKRLPSVAPQTIASGFDMQMRNGLQGAVTWYYSGKIPLNDANSAYADAYHLVGIKAGYENRLAKVSIKIYAGVDNLLNETYSLGNDINGFGGRYYNAAPSRNYYAGVRLQYLKGQ